MKTRPESAFWSGLLVLAGLSVLVVGAIWLRSFFQWRSGHWFIVEFKKVTGLEPGSEVMVQGMRVGTVEKIEFKPPNTVQVFIRLEKDVPIYYPPASEITIRFGTLIGQPYVDILNHKTGKSIAKGDIVRGVDPISWEELVPQARNLATSLNEIFGNPEFQQNLERTVADLAASAKSLRAILESIRANDVGITISNLRKASERLNAIIADKRLDEIIRNVEISTRQISAILSDPKIKSGITRTLHEAELALSSIRKILGDEEMQSNLKLLVKNLRESSDELKKLLSEEGIGGELKRVLAEARETVASVQEVIGDPEVKMALKTTARNLAELTGKGHDVFAELEASLKRLREFIESTQDDLEKVAEHLGGITQDLDETLDAFKWLMTEGGLKENLKQVGENLKVTSENLKEATASVRELLTDEGTKASLKEGLREIGPTVSSVRQTAERGQKILQRLEVVTDLKTQAGSSIWFVPSFDETKGEIWTSLKMETSPMRLLAGTYTGKEGTRLNLQIQGKIGSKTLWRFGAFRSKLGVGTSWENGRLMLDVEAFNPERWQVNSWLRFQLSPSTFLRLGFEDLGRKPTFGLGLEFGRR